MEKYPAKQHARRVVEKLGVPNGLIYLPGTPACNNEDSDMPAPFRQRRYFYYISGCNEPGCHVIYDIQNDKLILFIPRIDPARVIWTGRGSTPAEALNMYDIDSVFYTDQRLEFIAKWLNHYKGNLYILHPEQNPLAAETHEIDFTSLQPAMNYARIIKDEHEIKLIKKANDISSRAHKAVLANILRFKNEAQVEGLFLNVCLSHQAKQQAYAPIAASGPNAGTLHYDSNNEDFGDRQLMCLDAGCEWKLYASDVTRTFPLSGNWPSKESEEIYRLVERMQEACISRMAPGTRFLDLHVLAHQIAIDGLLGLGILHNGTSEEIFNAGTSRAFFPHGLGHHVGLEVHDVGHAELISAAKAEQAANQKYIYPESLQVAVYDEAVCMAPATPQSGHLEAGMVVTVEPGIYFSTYALNMFYLPSPVHSKYINVSVLKNYLPVGGVRIEDDILVTSNGYENLTKAPKGDAMLEIIRTQGANLPGIRQSPSLTMPKSRASVGGDSVQVREEPLLRAPGIPEHMSGTQAVKRATTLPIRSAPGKSESPVQPSLPGPQMMVPSGALGLLIGPTGETIREIQDCNGVNILIDGLDKRVNGFCPLAIVGHPNVVPFAKRQITAIVDRFHQQRDALWNERRDIVNATWGSDVNKPKVEHCFPSAPKNPPVDNGAPSLAIAQRRSATQDTTFDWQLTAVNKQGSSDGRPSQTQTPSEPQNLMSPQECVAVIDWVNNSKEPISRIENAPPCAEKWRAPKPERMTALMDRALHDSVKHLQLAKKRGQDYGRQPQTVQQAPIQAAQSQAPISVSKTMGNGSAAPRSITMGAPVPSGNLSSRGANALQDYQMQLQLLEKQNKRRIQLARQAREAQLVPGFMGERALQEFEMQQLQEEQNRRRVQLAQQDAERFPIIGLSPQPPSNPAHVPSDNQSSARVAPGAVNELALQDFQMQLLLLEQQNKRRIQMAQQESQYQQRPFRRAGEPPFTMLSYPPSHPPQTDVAHVSSSASSPQCPPSPHRYAALNCNPRAMRRQNRQSSGPTVEEYLETTYG